MIVLTDVAGDEDDTYLGCEVLKILLQNAIYESLINVNTKIKENNTFIWPHPTPHTRICGSYEMMCDILWEHFGIPNGFTKGEKT